jgi:hypothetical protein
VVSDIHPHALIEAADCVAVRNSTLGFEALCYGKPVIALEHAKYRHPKLTLDAGNTDEGATSLRRVATGKCTLPDRAFLRQFVLHLLDRYLVPVRYSYYFEPAKLDLLAHFAQNEAHHALEQTLARGEPPRLDHVESRALRALARCALRGPRQHSFLQRQIRRVSEWMS